MSRLTAPHACIRRIFSPIRHNAQHCKLEVELCGRQWHSARSARPLGGAVGISVTTGRRLVSTEAKDFLARHAAKEGVRTTTSGLQYRVIRAGPAEAHKYYNRKVGGWGWGEEFTSYF